LTEGEKKEKVGLSWRDYLALFLAALETAGLPLLILILIIAIVLALSRLVR